LKLTGGKTQPSFGQAPNLWKVCAEATERRAVAAAASLRVATMMQLTGKTHNGYLRERLLRKEAEKRRNRIKTWESSYT
jgi:hypothetical protein